MVCQNKKTGKDNFDLPFQGDQDKMSDLLVESHLYPVVFVTELDDQISTVYPATNCELNDIACIKNDKSWLKKHFYFVA